MFLTESSKLDNFEKFKNFLEIEKTELFWTEFLLEAVMLF
jgi:hypothetical protein